MRCYAHLYHAHWLDPFWHAGSYKELNTCFVHFVNVGRYFGLLSDKEMEPMQPLVDIWSSKDLLGPTAQEVAAREQAVQQQRLLSPSNGPGQAIAV